MIIWCVIQGFYSENTGSPVSLIFEFFRPSVRSDLDLIKCVHTYMVGSTLFYHVPFSFSKVINFMQNLQCI